MGQSDSIEDMSNGEQSRGKHEKAWVGDAVLTLFAREYILREDGGLDAAKSSRLTSNHFLSAFGEPTAVEARSGQVYEKEGLDAAFAWIASELLPRFEKQEAKRVLAANGGRAPRASVVRATMRP